jgi:carbon-monoxide dehydrogenase large subunit
MSTSPLRSAGRFVGQSVKRKEDPRLVTGHGRYVDDVTVPGLLHAAFLRSDVARGRITRLDCR